MGDPQNDEVVGQVHSSPGPAPGQDEIVGGSQQDDDAATRRYLNRSFTSLYNQTNPPPQKATDTPVADVAKDVAGSTARGSVGVLDTLLNPSQLVVGPLVRGGLAAYDYLAPKVGLPQTTPEQRSDLLDPTGPVSTAVSSVPGPNPMSTPPRTSVGQTLDVPIQGAITSAALSPSRALLAAGLGAGGAAAGEGAASLVDERYAPLVGMLANMAVQGGGQAAFRPRIPAGVDPPTARIAEQGRTGTGPGADVQIPGQPPTGTVPFTGPDITPGSPYRTNASVQGSSDAIQGRMIRDMGLPANAGPDANRITPDMINTSRTATGMAMDNFGQQVTAGPMQTFRMLTQLRQLDQQAQDPRSGISVADANRIHAMYTDIRDSVDQNNGTLSGTTLQNFTRTDSRLDDLQNDGDPNVARFGRRMMEATRDGFQASMSPDQAATYGDLRYRYRLASTLQPLVQDRQGRSLDMGDVSKAITGSYADYGPGDPRIGRFQREASVLSEGAAPQQPFALGDALKVTPSGATAMALNPKVAAAVELLRAGLGAGSNLRGAYLRSNYATQGLLNDVLRPQQDTLGRVGVGLLGGAALP